MQLPQQHLRINLVEVKGQLFKKIGMERSKQYFDYLNRFLSLKLSKSEFDKLCLGTIGKDNIRLHNQLIRAVLKNACIVTVGNNKPLDGIYHQNGLVPVVTHGTSLLTLVNGGILPPSPRKARTGACDRRVVDCKSAHGLNSTNSQELIKEAENGAVVVVDRVEQTESLGKRDGKITSDRTSLHAPLGVPRFPICTGRAYTGNDSKCVGVLHTDGLLQTTTLKERMEQIITLHGLQNVSMDCANVLNSGLDAYLKGLIRSCVELNGSRSVHKLTQSNLVKHPNHIRSLHGVGPGHRHQMQEQEPKPKQLVTSLDFRLAMELNCRQLGEDWPVLLEKICCTCEFEE